MSKIPYKLAEKLKNDGFPYKFIDPAKYYGDQSCNEDGVCLFIPNLSELIEACGDGFVTLIRMKSGDWRCNPDQNIESIGSTPEEAVSNLYLLLNKKKNY